MNYLLFRWDATVTQVKRDEGAAADSYLVHFKGWKKRWDKWVGKGEIKRKMNSDG